jgi:hypothetical protein
MLSLLVGLVVYAITFALITWCARFIFSRRSKPTAPPISGSANAEGDQSAADRPEDRLARKSKRSSGERFVKSVL